MKTALRLFALALLVLAPAAARAETWPARAIKFVVPFGPVTVTVNNQAATHFQVTAQPTATAGTSFNFQVTALDASNNVAIGYTGAVIFSSSDVGISGFTSCCTRAASDSRFSVPSAWLMRQ